MKTAQASVLQFPKTEPEAVALIREGAALKNQIDDGTAKLRDIHRRLAELATFPEGKSTATMTEAGYKVTIQKKTYTKLDQVLLDSARRAMGNDAFLKPFTYKFEARSKKELDAFLSYGNPDHVAMIRAAMEISEGQPQVKYEQVS